MLNIAQLKSKWNKEKESYARKEIGDGVQKFVKDFIKSPDFFNLKDGLNSTQLEKIKNIPKSPIKNSIKFLVK